MKARQQKSTFEVLKDNYLVILGLGITWLVFRGDYVARYLVFGNDSSRIADHQGIYYAFIVSFIICAILGPLLKPIAKGASWKKKASALLCVGCVGPLLLILSNQLSGDASMLAGMAGSIVLSAYTVIAALLWISLTTRLSPDDIFVVVTGAFIVSSALTLFRFVPGGCLAILLVLFPLINAVLFYQSTENEGVQEDEHQTSPIRSSSIGFPLILALFCLVGFSTRGIIANLESAAATIEVASINLIVIGIAVVLLIVGSRVELMRLIQRMALAFFVLFFICLCLAIVLNNVAFAYYYYLINGNMLVLRACLTYVWLLVTCYYASSVKTNLFATVSVLFIVPLSLAQGLRALLFQFDFAAEIYSTFFAPIMSLILIVAVVVLLGSHRQEVSRQPDQPMQFELDPRFIEAYRLTPREAEIASRLAKGYTLQRTSELLVISSNTVRTHVKSIYRKMGIQTKQELIDAVESWVTENV